ncbi:type IV secretion system DNA-binding domain-containing protein [Leptothoe sp. LEGE 181152]|nr:type IV secretion system DNA-binding domain-containing protein [Leptothoe sp. LEGE 181152]
MTIRFCIALGFCLWLVPWCVPVVQGAVNVALAEHSLGWLNPGNATGMLLGYATGGGVVSIIASASRRTKHINVREILWWLWAVTLVSCLYIGLERLLVLWVSEKVSFLAAVTVAALSLVQITRKQFPEYPFDSYVRGPKLVTSNEIRKKRGELPPGLSPWGADYIDIEAETTHTMLLGNIGGGKSTFLKAMMSWLAWREDKLWIVFDCKIELVPYLEALGKRVLIFNPLDNRRVAWDIKADIVNEPQVITLVKAFIHDEDGQESYWSQSAQNLLISVIGFFIRSGKWWDLRDVLLACSSADCLKAILGEDTLNTIIAEGLEGKSESSGTNDYMLTLNNRLRPLRVMAALWHTAEEKVSLKALIENDDFGNTAIVLGNDNTSGATVQTLNAILFERLVNLILDLPDDRLRRIWLWIDEISEASQFVSNNLVRFMTIARSRGGCAVLSAQNTAGIDARFGEKAAKQILELSSRLAVLGGVDGDTARTVSETYLGEVERIEAQVGYSEEYQGTEREVGETFKRKGDKEVSPTFRRVKRLLVPKEQLFSSSIPQTGVTNGLTGLFLGGKGGHHWHTYSWDEIKSMQIDVEEDILAYDRIGDEDTGLRLAPWSEEELIKWGLLDAGSQLEQLPKESPLFPREGDNSKSLSRADVVRILKIEDSELDEIASCCSLPYGLETFSKQEFTELIGWIGLELLDISVDWEDTGNDR